MKIISEVRKRDKCDPNVAACYASIGDADILSVVVLGLPVSERTC
jgi:hypothetical protein